MKRRTFVEQILWGGAGLFGLSRAGQAQTPERPNILWLSCEDISAHLGCYGHTYARTPNLDRLAGEGVRYSHAFAHAPVCAPARSGLITGMYPASLGSHNMRSKATLPEHIRCFPEYLRRAGYYCTNAKKQDYNFIESKETWDKSSPLAHYRQRQPGQPFFCVFNATLTHESRIRAADDQFFKATAALKPEQRHDPAKVPLPSYHPDAPETRQDWARYHDLITALDYEVQKRLDKLEADGLAEDTIVFFFSDHGAGMPRSKRWPYESGTHVPLIVRFPEKYRHLAPAPPGSTVDRLVSFVDFGPTVLSLAGVPLPEHMQGKAFLGSQTAAPRTHVFLERDRMDERYDCVRAVRGPRFRYIRNFMPHLPYSQHLEYMYQMPTMQVLQRKADAGELDAAQQHFMAPEKPIEELYDTEADPHEINNLAAAPEHQQTLTEMRGVLRAWMLEKRDLALMPEAAMHRIAGDRPHRQMAQSEVDYPLEAALDTANLPLAGDEALPQLHADTESDEGLVRHWAILGLTVLHQKDEPALARYRHALEDAWPSVRAAAAEALCRAGLEAEALATLTALLDSGNEWLRLRCAIALDGMAERQPKAREVLAKHENDSNDYVKRVARHATGATKD